MAENIATTAEKIQPLSVGSRVPDVTLKLVDGKTCSLKEQLGGKPSLIILI